MSQILKIGQIVETEASRTKCQLEELLGGGTQGEVYRINFNGSPMALKWYFPQWIEQDIRQRERLEKAIEFGPPNDRFLWPVDLASAHNIPGYGYIMPLRESRFKGIVDLMKRKVEPTFRALATAGFELANSYLQLHSRGLCYRDISFGNVFFDPKTGEVRICDNDNVDVDGIPGSVDGTPRFMAPEIVRGDASPSTQTDLFSLAILLFYMLMVHHPLEGAKEQAIHCFDLPAMKKLYGTEPVFIFDPDDISNRPIPGEQDNALAFWPIYPKFLQELFIKAFTEGIRDPQNGRVREGEWRTAMIRLRDFIIYCPHCGSENFYDRDILKSSGKLNPCWSCDKEIQVPPRIRIRNSIVMLNHDTQLFPYHLENQGKYDFSRPVAAVNQNPKNPSIWGLKNLSSEKWVTTNADGQVKEVEPGRSTSIALGTKINFGKAEGEFRT
ncbi:MAG: protein kinase domain-containing protein [Nostoc sp. SerVER01]|nr:hypothetical protein [Nostoc sp. SerVER01]